MGDEEVSETPVHPNDQVTFRQYPDTAYRETYPPIPSKGKPTNVPIPDGLGDSWAGNAETARHHREQTGE